MRPDDIHCPPPCKSSNIILIWWTWTRPSSDVLLRPTTGYCEGMCVFDRLHPLLSGHQRGVARSGGSGEGLRGVDPQRDQTSGETGALGREVPSEGCHSRRLDGRYAGRSLQPPSLSRFFAYFCLSMTRMQVKRPCWPRKTTPPPRCQR